MGVSKLFRCEFGYYNKRYVVERDKSCMHGGLHAGFSYMRTKRVMYVDE